MTGLLIEISLPDLCVDSILQCVCLSALPPPPPEGEGYLG